MPEAVQNDSMGRLYEKTHSWLNAKVKDLGGIDNFVRTAKAKRATAYKVLGKDANTNARDYLTWLENLGAKIVFPDEVKDTTREICWVDAKRVGAENGAKPPAAENYFAVPLAKGVVAAGPGLVPHDAVKGWLLVYRYQKAIQHRTNLVAVEIGQGQESMAPTLHPEDIVLVDKDVRQPEPEGSIFLVRDKDDDVSIKRVTVERRHGETWLAYSSDNPDKRSYMPRFFNLGEDFGGDISRAIVGRVVWAWKDMTRK